MKTKKICIVLLSVVVLMIGMLVPHTYSCASTRKDVTIWSIRDNEMKYHKAYWSTEYIPNCDWENIIGGGKRHSITISKNCKFYTYNFTKMKPNRKSVSKSKFVKSTGANSARTYRSNGKKYYGGIYCIITISKGKVIKVVQQYQA